AADLRGGRTRRGAVRGRRGAQRRRRRRLGRLGGGPQRQGAGGQLGEGIQGGCGLGRAVQQQRYLAAVAAHVDVHERTALALRGRQRLHPRFVAFTEPQLQRVAVV